MAVRTNYCVIKYIQCYHADMPPLVVRSPLGLPLGDRGAVTSPGRLPAVGARVVAGGPYTLPILKKMFAYLYRGVQPDGCPLGRQTNVVPW